MEEETLKKILLYVFRYRPRNGRDRKRPSPHNTEKNYSKTTVWESKRSPTMAFSGNPAHLEQFSSPCDGGSPWSAEACFSRWPIQACLNRFHKTSAASC